MAGPQITASWKPPVVVAVARWTWPVGATAGSSAALAGASKAVAMPKTVTAP